MRQGQGALQDQLGHRDQRARLATQVQRGLGVLRASRERQALQALRESQDRLERQALKDHRGFRVR